MVGPGRQLLETEHEQLVGQRVCWFALGNETQMMSEIGTYRYTCHVVRPISGEASRDENDKDGKCEPALEHQKPAQAILKDLPASCIWDGVAFCWDMTTSFVLSDSSLTGLYRCSPYIPCTTNLVSVDIVGELSSP